MKRILITAIAAISLSGCISPRTHTSAIPLGNDLMEIDVSTKSHNGRAGAMEVAFNKAAQATIDAGYDKFIVINDNGWNESSLVGGSYGEATVNPSTGQATQSSFIGTVRHQEVKMVIRMYHDGDKGSAKAVDAEQVMKQQQAGMKQ